MNIEVMNNYINGQWVKSVSKDIKDIINPATDEVIARVPMSTLDEVTCAVKAAKEAYSYWRETPPISRARYLFRLKDLVEENFEELAKTIVEENGKTIDEARGEIRRGIENIETSTAITTLMMGYNLEDVAAGIDEYVIYQPLGVFVGIPPYNFPFMIPLLFLPYAIACGNTYILKPSEQVPLTQNKFFQLIDEVGFPPGVINLVNGCKDVSEALINNPDVKGISFVGSTKVAKLIYSLASSKGKRVQCQGGAKNFVLVMPDTNLESTIPALITSFYGCAGQRCLAGSVVIAVGSIYNTLKERFVEQALKLKIGNGLDETVQMGPLASKKQKDIVLSYIEIGIKEGAELILDGRKIIVKEYPNGAFLGPTIFEFSLIN
ncbi:MAG: aldehyde dehydrogenase family protein [Actinobacteria bacterium]|nr:aldehyde dehydrogenase family protein [Actinomycetota bacterium]